jgi:hypothetical protein
MKLINWIYTSMMAWWPIMGISIIIKWLQILCGNPQSTILYLWHRNIVCHTRIRCRKWYRDLQQQWPDPPYGIYITPTIILGLPPLRFFNKLKMANLSYMFTQIAFHIVNFVYSFVSPKVACYTFHFLMLPRQHTHNGIILALDTFFNGPVPGH